MMITSIVQLIISVIIQNLLVFRSYLMTSLKYICPLFFITRFLHLECFILFSSTFYVELVPLVFSFWFRQTCLASCVEKPNLMSVWGFLAGLWKYFQVNKGGTMMICINGLVRRNWLFKGLADHPDISPPIFWVPSE